MSRLNLGTKDLIGVLISRGLSVRLDGNGLKVTGNTTSMPEELQETLENRKPEIIKFLKGDITEKTPDPEIRQTFIDRKKEARPKPHLTVQGDLVIPFDCDLKYHWWQPDGMKVSEIREGLKRLAN